MTQLHANWFDSLLHVWGRDEQTGRIAAADELRAIIGEWSSDALLASVAAEGSLRLWLPTSSDAGAGEGEAPAEPTARLDAEAPARQEPRSPDTAHVGSAPRTISPHNVPTEGTDAALAVREVAVPTIQFPPTQAVDFLLSLPQAMPGVLTDSLTYWQRLARFVVQRLAARQFFPDLQGSADPPSAMTASWRLIVHGPAELDWLERYTSAMPPVCRAMSEHADEVDEQQLVESFLHSTTDALVRRAVAEDPFFQSIHERSREPEAPAEMRWLSALLGTYPAVDATGESAGVLLEQVRGWVSRLDEGRRRAVLRLCFKLIEPEEGRDVWRVVLQLQSLDADSQFIDAATLWEPGAQPGGILGRQVLDRRQQLLTQLARAAEVLPAAERALAMAAPAELALDPAEAHAFIRQWGPQLAERGFGVFLPDWVRRRDRELGLQLIVQPVLGLDEDADVDLGPPDEADRRVGSFLTPGGAQMGLESLLNFDWQIAVGDLRLTPEEFQSLTAQNQPLVRYRGQWLQVDLDASRRALEFLQRKPRGRLTLAEAIRTALATGRGETGLPVLGISGTDWIQGLLEQSPATRVQSLSQPAGFQGTLRPYQLRGLDWLAFLHRLGIGACLADDMGLGKTIQLIALMLHEREGSKGSGFGVQGSGDEEGTQARRHEGTKGDGEGQPGDGQPPTSGMGASPMRSSPSPGTPGEGRGEGPIQNHKSKIQNEAYPQSAEGQIRNPQSAIRNGANPQSAGPTLLFAPTSVVGNWLREVQRFAPSLRVMVHHGPDRLHGDPFAHAAKDHDLVITSYALAYRDLEDLRRPHWHRIALDEAQKIKNPSAASTLAIRSLNAVHRVAMTGTPIENHLSELWSIMEILNPGLLGSAGEFRERFAVPIERLADQDRAQLLRRMIQPFVLRRLKTDPHIAGDLPEKMEMRVFCNLTPEQAGIYQRITEEMLGQIDAAAGIRRRGLILAALTRLKQVCDHPALLEQKSAVGSRQSAVFPRLPTAACRLPTALSGRSGKCERLVEMLEEVVEEGDSALVFTQYREMGYLLETLLTERLRTGVLFLHGGTPAKQRDALVAQFQQPGSDARIFILSLRAGGLGLNLTAANHVFHFDRWWNPAVEAQATDRAHRIGQTRKVQVHKYVCIGTMEERIDRMLNDKLALAGRIVGTGDEWLTNLSTEELRQTLALTADAVGEF